MDRVILHCDLNNFYASVECVSNPILWNKPVAVTGNPRTRHGIILAKNYKAKEYGIKTGQTIWEAKLACPKLICLPPQHEKYTEYSNRAKEVYKRYTDQVESFGPDECWLDITHSVKLFGSGKKVADEIRQTIKAELGLTVSVGVSFNKFFAKLGSDMKKPDATTVISPENFRDKIWGLPADSLIFIGRHTYDKLKKFNIYTIGDLAKADSKLLTEHFGILGAQYHTVANGDDNTEVLYGDIDITKSVGNGMTTIRDLITREEVDATVLTLAEKVTFRMREAKLSGRTAHISVRNSDLSSKGHSVTLIQPIDNGIEMAKLCMDIFDKYWTTEPFSIRTIRISMSNLVRNNAPLQLNFLQNEQSLKRKRLDRTLDEIRKKYGYYSVRRAKTIKRDFINYFEADEENDSSKLKKFNSLLKTTKK